MLQTFTNTSSTHFYAFLYGGEHGLPCAATKCWTNFSSELNLVEQLPRGKFNWLDGLVCLGSTVLFRCCFSCNFGEGFLGWSIDLSGESVCFSSLFCIDLSFDTVPNSFTFVWNVWWTALLLVFEFSGTFGWCLIEKLLSGFICAHPCDLMKTLEILFQWIKEKVSQSIY